jgi:hypothetical protein
VTFFGRQLRHHGAIADHGLDQILGQRESGVGPIENPTIETAYEQRRKPQPQGQQDGVADRRGPQGQDEHAASALGHVGEQRWTAGSGQRVQSVGIEDHAEQAADASGTYRVRRQAQDAAEQALARESPHVNRESPCPPNAGTSTDDEGEQHHGPSNEPAAGKMAIQGRGADEPPRHRVKSEGEQIERDGAGEHA